MKLSMVRQLYHADLMYMAALLDLAFLEKATSPDASYRSCVVVRLQAPKKLRIKDEVALPDHYQIILHLQAFIEKAAKSIGLCTERVRPSELKLLNHSLISTVQAAGLPLPQLKGQMTPDSFTLLNELHKADYGRLRYLKGQCRITFNIAVIHDLISFFKNALFQARIAAIYSDPRKLEFVRAFNKKYPAVSNFIPLDRLAPTSLDREDFENIVRHKSHLHRYRDENLKSVHLDNVALSETDAKFIKSCYDLNGNVYSLKQPIDNQTSRKLFKLLGKASYHAFDPVQFKLVFGRAKKQF